MNKELDALKKQFDKVFVRHELTDTGLGGSTTIHLVKGEHVFIGVAKCHSDDQFNRRLGRTIAIGRAIHAFDVHSGNKAERAGETSGIGYLVYASEDSKPTVIIDRYV